MAQVGLTKIVKDFEGMRLEGIRQRKLMDCRAVVLLGSKEYTKRKVDFYVFGVSHRESFCGRESP